MTTELITIAIFCLVDDRMPVIKGHPQAKLYSELVIHMKKLFHRLSTYIEARLAYTAAMFNVLLALFHRLGSSKKLNGGVSFQLCVSEPIERLDLFST